MNGTTTPGQPTAAQYQAAYATILAQQKTAQQAAQLAAYQGQLSITAAMDAYTVAEMNRRAALESSAPTMQPANQQAIIQGAQLYNNSVKQDATAGYIDGTAIPNMNWDTVWAQDPQTGSIISYRNAVAKYGPVYRGVTVDVFQDPTWYPINPPAGSTILTPRPATPTPLIAGGSTTEVRGLTQLSNQLTNAGPVAPAAPPSTGKSMVPILLGAAAIWFLFMRKK